MALADPEPKPAAPEPLRIVGVIRPLDGTLIARDESKGYETSDLLFTFNRRPTDEEMRALQELLPSFAIKADAMRFYERVVLAELAVRLFRTLILGGIVLADTPAAMDWIRDWIDGTNRGHGPIGHPMIWPDRLPAIAALLRGWGFQPTPTVPPYVTHQPSPRPSDANGTVQ